jgi:hypothetical protein
MAKFYVAGITKYEPNSDKYDVLLKLEGFETYEADLRLQILDADLPNWITKIGKYSDEFNIIFS